MDSHLQSDHLQKFAGTVGPLLATPPVLQTFTIGQNPQDDALFNSNAADTNKIYVIINANTNDNGATFLNLVRTEIALTTKGPGNLSDEIFRSTRIPI